MELPQKLLDEIGSQFAKNYEGYEFDPKIRVMESNVKEAKKKEKATKRKKRKKLKKCRKEQKQKMRPHKKIGRGKVSQR